MTAQEKQCLRQALQTLDQMDLRQFDALNDSIPPFSKHFEDKMQALIYSSDINVSKKIVHRRVFFVVCALFLAFALSLSVSAIREPIFRFFKNVYQNSIGFYAQELEAPNVISEQYTLYELPEGYEAAEKICYDGVIISRWWKKDQYISLEQYTLKSINISVSNRDDNGEMLSLRGTEMFHITSKGTHTFIWSEKGYSFTIICPTDLPFEDICRMIESIRPVAQ